MASNTTVVDATPEQVFAVLLDPWSYADWVVGSKKIRAVDDDWPRAGSRLHHRVGVGPVLLDDNSLIVAVDPPRRLVLHARGMPLGVARVALTVTPVDGGTEIRIDEEGIGGPGGWLWNPLFDGLTWLRNVETLRRLSRLARQRPRPDVPTPDPRPAH